MRRVAVFALMLCVAALGISATTELAFMRFFPGARYAAMGGALTGLPAEPDTVFFSPAGLAFMKGTSLTFSHTEYYAGSRYEEASAIRQLGDSTALAISVLYLWTGTQDRRDSLGLSLGTFSPYQAVPVLSVSKGLTKDISLGFNMKFPYENLDGSEAFRVLYDFSALLNILECLSFGACLVNAGTYQDLPVLVKAGLGFSSGVIKADLDAEFKNAGSPVYAFGVSVLPEEFLALMAGVCYDSGTTLNILNCFSFGVEISVRRFSLSCGMKVNYSAATTQYGALRVRLD